MSTTTAEIESLKQRHPHLGSLLQGFKDRIEQSSTSILTLNTIANTAGMSLVGAITVALYPDDPKVLGWLTAGMVVAILIVSEILPKNVGLLYRRPLQVYLVYTLLVVNLLMKPVAWIVSKFLRSMVLQQQPTAQEQEEEILLLTERSAQAGTLSKSERDLITNALGLDDVSVADIMTPRTVTFLLGHNETVGEVCVDLRRLPFSRIPVYGDGFDDIIGTVKRRDLMEAYSEDKDDLPIRELMKKAIFIPETASALDALQHFLRAHNQLAVVVDEFGSTVGVVTMEDIFEELIGKEIYDESDIAVDMRELAKKRAEKRPPATPSTVDGADLRADTPEKTDHPVSPVKSEQA